LLLIYYLLLLTFGAFLFMGYLVYPNKINV